MFENLNEHQTKLAAQIALGIFAAFLLYTLRIFMDAFLGAVIVYVLFRPVMNYLMIKKKRSKGFSAFLVILSTVFIILIPMTLIISYVVPKLMMMVGDRSMMVQMMHDADTKFMAMSGRQLFSPENVLSLQQKATEMLTGMLGSTFTTLGDIVIMYFILFYLLVSTGKIEESIENYLPMSNKTIARFTHELEGITYANALGAPLLGVIEGLFAGIGFWIFGINEPVFWGIMCGLFSFVPTVGSSLIWIPACIIKMTSGDMWQGVGLLIFSLIFIVGFENVFRLSLQKRMANVHPLVTMLGFILGISLFGLPGIIIGPLLLSWFLLMLKIYREEFVAPAPSQINESDKTIMK